MYEGKVFNFYRHGKSNVRFKGEFPEYLTLDRWCQSTFIGGGVGKEFGPKVIRYG